MQYAQLILLLLVVVGTLFWATRGALSAALMFGAALFASILAIGTYESFIPLFSRFRADFAAPVVFFLIFAFAFSVLRLAGGLIAPKNIRLPAWIDISAAVVLGFMTSMVAFGTLVIAVEMLPGYQVILNFDRFPNGLAREPAKFWIPADTFTRWTWSMMSGGSLLGEPLTDTHPDLERELYGDRHVVTFGSYPVVPQDLLRVAAVYVLNKPEAIRQAGIPLAAPKPPAPKTEPAAGDAGTGEAPPPVAEIPQKVVIVRSVVARGTERPNSSEDLDHYYRITPAQVRLVANSGGLPAQYFPIGYMEDGKIFKDLPLDTGHLVLDYNSEKSEVINDWVFMVPADAEPRLFGEKQIARVAIGEAAASATTRPDVYVNAGALYPPLAFLKNLPALQVQVKHSFGQATDQPVVGQMVYVFRPAIIKRSLNSYPHTYIDDAYELLNDYDPLSRQSQLNRFRDMKVAWGQDHFVPLEQFLDLMFTAHTRKDAREEVDRADHFINETIMPILLDPDRHLLVWKDVTDKDGKTAVKNIAPGQYLIVTWSIEQKQGVYHFWWHALDLAKKVEEPVTVVLLNDANAHKREVR